MKDGLIFTHVESLYELEGLNTLVLHWRDPYTSTYCSPLNIEPTSDAVLYLSESYHLETLE